MAKKLKRHLDVLLGDTHAGYRFGLMPEGFSIPDEQGDMWYPELTEWQKVLWARHEAGREAVAELAGRDPVRVFHLGDPTHGNHFPDKELVSAWGYHHFMIAAANARPWLDMKQVEAYLLIQGTGVHEFGQGTSTHTVKEILAKEYPKKMVESYQHPIVTTGGLRYDLAHHGPGPGTREWTKTNVLRLYTQSIQKAELKEGREPPDLVARGHYHSYAYTMVTDRARGKTWKTHAVITPAFAILDDYARKVTRSEYKADFGVVCIEIIDGRIHHVYDEDPFIETVDLRQEVNLDGDE